MTIHYLFIVNHPEPDYTFNGDLVNIVTPVNILKLQQMLIESNYDAEETTFLVNGFTHGFDIGYEGPVQRRSTSDNIPLTVGNKTILWNKLIKEVKHGRVAGPFEEIPFENFIQSPIGLVPKAGGDRGETILIFYLSYSFKNNNLKSLNFYTLRERCTVNY